MAHHKASDKKKREKHYTSMYECSRETWEKADRRKLGQLYRATIKFDRGLKYTGDNKQEILELTDNRVSFDGDDLLVNYGRYPIGVMVCVNLTGAVDVWREETFLSFFEPWPEDGSRSNSRTIT